MIQIEDEQSLINENLTIETYLKEHNIWSHTVKHTNETISYTYFMMFRHNKKPPLMLTIVVDRLSKEIMYAYIGEKMLSSFKELTNFVERK